MGNELKRLLLQSVVLFGVLILICIIFRIRNHNIYIAPVPEIGTAEDHAGWQVKKEELPPGEDLQVQIRNMEDETGGIEAEEAVERDGDSAIALVPKVPGEYEAKIQDSLGDTVARKRFYVDRFRTVYDLGTGGFTGDTFLMAALTAFFLLESFLMMRAFLRAKGAAFYTYTTIYLAGFSLFLFLTGLTLLYTTVRHILDPDAFTMRYVYGILSSASFQYMILTAPFVFAFACAMTVSNIALIRHEGKRFKNFIGILISIMMAGGELAAIIIYLFFTEKAAEGFRITSIPQNLFATVYVYFECMLFGAIICGITAARNIPSRDCSHIVILGCGFRKDGSLPPLLRGRVDRAISFRNQQREAGLPGAVFVPSGGQGPNECMSEAEAMQRYLLSQGVPQESILPEMQSRNTYQNMAYSKSLIEERDPDAKVIFSTTNYHVFRSGVWASLAGLHAEGIGARTKWWFWPNAFMRECVGLLVNRWKQEILFLVIMVGIFGMLSILL